MVITAILPQSRHGPAALFAASGQSRRSAPPPTHFANSLRPMRRITGPMARHRHPRRREDVCDQLRI
jgi:hypothetical protein